MNSYCGTAPGTFIIPNDVNYKCFECLECLEYLLLVFDIADMCRHKHGTVFVYESG